MNIRKAAKTDTTKIQHLVLSLSHFYLSDTSSELPAWFLSTLLLTEFEHRIGDEGFKNFVVEIESEIAGYISVKGDNYLYHLFVAEKHQGKGVAKLLWLHALNFLSSPTISLRSSSYAIPIYKKFGFIESGDIGEKDGMQFQPMEFLRSS